MNPVDHPPGGGEGRTSAAVIRHPLGQPTKGKNPLEQVDQRFILISRHKRKVRNADMFVQSERPVRRRLSVKKADAARASGRHDVIKIWSRRRPFCRSSRPGVRRLQRQKHVPVSVNEEMVGHKFGEFSPTRTFHGHSGDKKQEGLRI